MSSANFAVVGAGRTGSYVVEQIEALAPQVNLAAVFDEHNPVTASALSDIDVAIVFVPPTAMAEVVPQLIEARVNVVCGTTGFDWPADFAEQVALAGSRWVIAHNFSLGMNLVRRCIEILGHSALLYGQPQFHIEEVHHTKKLDAPSGTAISWRDWLARDCEISSIREGDVKGIHQLNVETEYEKIELRHEAKDRALFAQGAVWAAQELLTQLPPAGVIEFSTLVDNKVNAGLLPSDAITAQGTGAHHV